MAAHPPAKIDRQTTAPFLLRLFFKQGAFHRYNTPRCRSSCALVLKILDWTSSTHLFHDFQHTSKYTLGRAVAYESYANCCCQQYPHSYRNHMLARGSLSDWYTQTYKAQIGPAHQDASFLETSDPS